MGQGASTPHGNERAGRGEGNIAGSRTEREMDTEMTSPAEDSGNGSGGEDRTRLLRRSRRLRSHLQQLTSLGSRLMPNSLSSTSSSSGETSGSSRTYARLQNRLRALEGSPPTSRSSSRDNRRHSTLSRFTPFRSESSPVVPTVHRAAQVEDEEPRLPRFSRRETDPDVTLGSTSAEMQNRRASYAGPSSSTGRSTFSRVRSSLAGLPLMGHDPSTRPRSFAGGSSRRGLSMDALFDRSEENTPMPDADLRPSVSSADENAPSTSTSEGEGNQRGQESDQQAVLSRLLSVAAAMTAASLVGSNEQALSEARDVGNDNGEGSFETFLRALRGGHLAAALRNGGSEMGGGVNGINNQATNDGTNGPLNFFRMFRFGPTTNNSNDTAAATPDEPRMVPVVIVGIRSVNGQADGGDSVTTPFFDAMPPWNGAGANTRTFPRSRVPRPTATTDPLRSPRRHSRNHSASDHLHFPGFSPTLSDHQEDPFTAPRPATSGQAERTNNNLNSEEHTHAHTHTHNHTHEHTQENGTGEEGARPSSRRDSFGSAAGGATSSRRPPEGTRSWIIYVLGGAYPENHPILTTPSLFTDNPTYEDMVLLSSLIGNVKPPVASREDVDRAGGIFTFGDMKDPRTVALQGERCLVCLGDYEDGEICRQITSCSHIFHKECIDEWLTTGRNTCPLCRGEGVERKKQEEAAAAAATAAGSNPEQPVPAAPSAAAGGAEPEVS